MVDGSMTEATVVIERPIIEVFGFYRDFRNLPRFLGDVMAIEATGPTSSHWTIQVPFGLRVHWDVEVTEVRLNELIRYRTVGTPGRITSWEVHFSPGSNATETQVHAVMRTPLGVLGRAGLALLGKFPAREQASNLHRLKEVLETGHVTDTSYAVAGKFGGQH